MKTKHFACNGQYAVWNFSDGSPDAVPVVYHQSAPQLYHPVDEIAPFLAAVVDIPRPVTIRELWERGYPVPIPGVSDPTEWMPRYKTIDGYQTASMWATGRPPVDPIRSLDALVWAFWDGIKFGPYRPSTRRTRGGTSRRPAGAAVVWDVLDTPDGVKLGFTAFDKDGQPSPWLTVAPCAPAEFVVLIRTDDTLSALAGL